MSGQVEFLLGNEAILEGALAAGADFYGGYPITPSSEIAEAASRRLPVTGGTYIQMEDEIASLGAVIGAVLAGARAFTATSGPGFSLMQEHLGLAYMAEIPLVVVNIQRSGPSTGLATRPGQGDLMQARWGSHGDYQAVVFAPSTVEQCFTLTHAAFSWSEQLRMPVILLADEIIGHIRERVCIDSELTPPTRRVPECTPSVYQPYRAHEDGVPPLATFGSDYVFHINGSMHDETGFPASDPTNARRVIKRLSHKVTLVSDALARYHRCYEYLVKGSSSSTLIVAYGASARAAREAGRLLQADKQSALVLELQCLWPFPAAVVAEHASKADRIVVAEMSLGQLVGEVERACRDKTVTGCFRADGEPITPAEIISTVRGLRYA